MTRSRPDLRLAPAALSAWAAAWWATGSTPARVWAAAGGALVLALGTALAVVRVPPSSRRAPWAAGALAFAVIGVVLATAGGALTARSAGSWPGWVAARAVARLNGTLASDPHRLPGAFPGAGDRYVLTLDLTSAAARGAVQPLAVPVLVLAPASWRGLSAGQRVALSGRLAPTRPGDEAAAVVTALGGPPQASPGGWPWRVAERVRQALRDACRGLPPDAGGLLPSLVDGDGSGLPDPLRADLKTAGLTHLTAVSGANLTIIADSMLWVAGALRAPRSVRVPLMVVTLAGFVVLARPSPSVLRAAGMGAVGIAASALSRRPRGVPALAAAATVLLAVDPWLARSAGFALSAAATGALLLLAPLWADRLVRHVPQPAAIALAAPAAAQVACGPLLVLLQPSVSLVAVPANLLAEPAVAPTTVAGVVTAGAGIVAPGAAHVGALVGGAGTWWIALVAHRAAALPLASAPWPSGPPGALLLAVLEAGVVAMSLPQCRTVVRRVITRTLRARTARRTPGRRASGEPRGTPVSRRTALLGLTGAVTGGIALWAAGLRLRPRGSGGLPDWSVVMLDVGQGDATVLRSGRDRAVLIDTGPDPALVDACLSRLGIRHLDLVVLTHFHADHVGGLPGALKGRVAHRILVSPLAEPTENAVAVLRLAGTARIPVETARPQQQGVCAADGWSVAWRVLTPFGPLVPPAPPETDDSDLVNESSVAVTADARSPSGSVRAVLLGDLETQGQRGLAQRLATGADELGGPVDVVKVAHHGSAKQHEPLYRQIEARLGLIGVGAGNDYGHPAPSALALLRRAGVAVLRTDTSGDLAIAGTPTGGLTVATSR
jgi:competence protein ComEC